MVDKLEEKAVRLLEALERGEQETVLEAQESFSQTVRAAWEAYETGSIRVAARGLPRAMAMWAVEELPQRIGDSSQWPRLAKELRQFLLLMDNVVLPEEVG